MVGFPVMPDKTYLTKGGKVFYGQDSEVIVLLVLMNVMIQVLL